MKKFFEEDLEDIRLYSQDNRHLTSIPRQSFDKVGFLSEIIKYTVNYYELFQFLSCNKVRINTMEAEFFILKDASYFKAMGRDLRSDVNLCLKAMKNDIFMIRHAHVTYESEKTIIINKYLEEESHNLDLFLKECQDFVKEYPNVKFRDFISNKLGIKIIKKDDTEEFFMWSLVINIVDKIKTELEEIVSKKIKMLSQEQRIKIDKNLYVGQLFKFNPHNDMTFFIEFTKKNHMNSLSSLLDKIIAKEFSELHDYYYRRVPNFSIRYNFIKVSDLLK